MVSRSLLALKVLINRFHKADEDLFLKPLPEDEKNAVLQYSFRETDLKGLKPDFASAESKLHYSWLAAEIKNLSDEKKIFALATINEDDRRGLLDLLQDPNLSGKRLTKAGHRFFKERFFLEIRPSEILPLAYVGHFSMSPLLELEKNKLLEVIDFLGVYDLAEKIRSVVDKKKLSSIYGSLTSKEQKFLSYTLRSGEKTLTSDLDLRGWNGDSKKLKAILHKKGLIRFAKALSDEPADFLWHLFHKLDTGRFAFIEKHLLPKPAELIRNKLKEQILHILNIVDTQGTKT